MSESEFKYKFLYQDLKRAVYEMRYCQKRYFESKDYKMLIRAKQEEKHVDKLLEEKI